MKDRIEIDGVSYVKEEPKKESYFLAITSQGPTVVTPSNRLEYRILVFDINTIEITKQEADYASNKPTEGDWEFRLPEKGDTLLTYNSRKELVATSDYSPHYGFLSGRRWCKKKEEPKEITFEELYEVFFRYYLYYLNS